MSNPGTEAKVRARAFTLELTKGCNLRCAYCYYAERPDAFQPSTRMTREVAEQSVDVLLRDGPADEPAHVHFFGGEPLLNFALLRHTVLYGERRALESGRRITFEVTTNGTRLSEEVVAFLDEHAIHVGVSFDGPPHVQDVSRPLGKGSSHALAEPGIRRLLQSRRGTPLAEKTHCSVVVTRLEPDLVGIVRHLEGLGFTRIILTPATDLPGHANGFRLEDLPALLGAYDDLAREYEDAVSEGREVAASWYPLLMSRLLSGERRTSFCSGGQDYLGVAADGTVSLCYRFYENEEFSMGSVQDGIDREVTRRLDATPLETRTTCSRCWARHFCGGGCHHDNLMATGSTSEPNAVMCDVFRHSMGRTLEMWARLSRQGRLGGRQGGYGKERVAVREEGGFDPADRPKRTAGCHTRALGDERIVYEPRSHEVVVLNPTAAFIFEHCTGEHSVADLLELLQRRYQAPQDRLRQDLLATLDDLRSRSLLT